MSVGLCVRAVCMEVRGDWLTHFNCMHTPLLLDGCAN